MFTRAIRFLAAILVWFVIDGPSARAEEKSDFGFESLENSILADFKAGKGIEALKKYLFDGPAGKYISEDRKTQVIGHVSVLLNSIGPIFDIRTRYRVKCISDLLCSSAAIILTERQPQFLILRFYKNPKSKSWVFHEFHFSDISHGFADDPILKSGEE